MKKLFNILLVASIATIIIVIIGVLLVNVGNFEIRKSWLTNITIGTFALSCIILLTLITIKAFTSKSTTWLKYILIAGYSLIALVVLLNHYKFVGIFKIVVIIYPLAAILALEIFKADKWKRIFFSIHSIILSLLALLLFVVNIIINEKDVVRNDVNILYKSEGGRKKVIIQGEESYERLYIISHDLGIIRKRTEFNGTLPDGKWEVYNKSNEIIAIVVIENGEEISRESVPLKNSIIVKTIDDIKRNLYNEGTVFLLDGEYIFGETIEIFGSTNIKFESIPSKVKTRIETTTGPCFKIISSSNITIHDIDLSATNSNEIIEVIESTNINITQNRFLGEVKNGISVDATSNSIYILKNEFINISESSIVANSFNTTINNNKFKSECPIAHHRFINLLDKQYDSETVIDLIQNALLKHDSETHLNNKGANTVELFGKQYSPFEGTIEDLFYSNNISSTIRNFITSDYSTDVKCSYPYYFDALGIIANRSLFLCTPTSNDPWCFDENGKPKFSLVNPNFFRWFRSTFSLDPNNNIQEVTYSYIFEKFFKNFFRAYYVSFLQIKGIEGVEYRIENYKEFVNASSWRTDLDLFVYHEFIEGEGLEIDLQYIKNTTEERTSNLDRFYQNSHVNLHDTKILFDSDSIDAKTFSKLISFWVRRHIDGSAEQIFQTLDYYLRKFDPEWVSETKRTMD
jgi:hypothetical protein